MESRHRNFSGISKNSNIKKIMKKGIMIISLLTIVAPLCASAQGSFVDNCTTFDSSLWNLADWAMGRGSVLPADVSPSGGGIYNFTLPADTYNGGEIYSKAQYFHGQVETQMKCADVPGVISSIYMYQGQASNNDEIDIEVYLNSGSWEIAFTVYRAGVKTWTHSYFPSWDPSASYNDYEIDYESGAITFYVNGGEEAQCNTVSELPTNPMNIQMIDWWPTWLSGADVDSNEFMQVNWISFTAD
jgi:beta-glucanase (GH16 family)